MLSGVQRFFGSANRAIRAKFVGLNAGTFAKNKFWLTNIEKYCIIKAEAAILMRQGNHGGIMKKNIIIALAVSCAAAAAILFVNTGTGSVVDKAALAADCSRYLSEKYGSQQVGRCVYRRMGYTDSNRDILGNGSKTVYPDLAVFKHDGGQITVQRSDGKFCDDGQISQLPYLIAEHFSEKCGVEITFAELRSCSNGSIVDSTPTNLVRRFNQWLDKDNIGEILLDFAQGQPYLELALYLPDIYPDRRELTEKLAHGLSPITSCENFSRVRFFLYSPDEELIVNSTLGASRDKNAGDYEYRALNFPYYYAANAYLHWDLDIEGTVYYNKSRNTITAAGSCILDRGYSAGLGSGEYEQICGWQVYDLSAKQ